MNNNTAESFLPSEVLPHAEPMVLISSIGEFDLDTRTLTAWVTIRENDIFFDKMLNGVPAYVALEYMAQTIGCLPGIIEKQQNIEPKVGFVIGTRSLTTYIDKFSNGESYSIFVKQLFLDDGLASFECSISSERTSECCAKAIVNVYLPENIHDFIGNIN